MDFGTMVCAGRERKQLTKTELARRIGCDHARLHRIESGRAPTAKQAAALIRELDLDETEALAALERRGFASEDTDDDETAPADLPPEVA